ncbi:hypothetical protein RDI58_006908 [Solanum bulbocastanum]|jgi:ectoine hydroxylase-related dioxygenase (phytanoyl-CoA dioxygenase family)
MGLAL